MITEGYLARHTPPGRGRRGPALLDVVQDYALAHLHAEGAFELGVVLKGGTSLRKVRAGAAGRFSTDLDFAAPDDTTVDVVFDILDGASFHGVTFSVRQRKGPHGKLDADSALGQPDIPGKIEVSTRPLWLATEWQPPIALPVHKAYEFELPPMPVPAVEEAIAEKLAAWRRRRKQRDLYDLHWFASTMFDEALVRRLTVLKIWHDVVVDGLGTARSMCGRWSKPLTGDGCPRRRSVYSPARSNLRFGWAKSRHDSGSSSTSTTWSRRWCGATEGTSGLSPN